MHIIIYFVHPLVKTLIVGMEEVMKIDLHYCIEKSEVSAVYILLDLSVHITFGNFRYM